MGPSPSDGGMLGVASVAMDAVAGPDGRGGDAWSVGPFSSGDGMPGVAPVVTDANARREGEGSDTHDVRLLAICGGDTPDIRPTIRWFPIFLRGFGTIGQSEARYYEMVFSARGPFGCAVRMQEVRLNGPSENTEYSCS